MNCASCGQTIDPGAIRCPLCGASVPRASGLPFESTPPHPRVPREPTPEPAMRRRPDRVWREEVSERVRDRRRDRGIEDELPLFPARSEPPRPGRPATPPAVRPPEPAADPVAELDLRPDAVPLPPEPRIAAEPEPFDSVESEEEPLTAGSWLMDNAHVTSALTAAERPAGGLERAQAATVDVAILLSVWGLVVYFAAKATRMGVAGLAPSWPAIASYLGFLALIYAAYFTGVAGRTPGKMLVGLRVVDTHGQAPGFPRALLRMIFGTLGIAAAGVGLLPMIFDPARRALHDRLLRTRVIRT